MAFNLQTLDGKSIALETFRGKPFVLNFSPAGATLAATTMPLINELANQGEKEG